MGAIAALASSLLWGTSDFCGGRATTRFGALRVLTWSQLATTLAMWVVASALVVGGVAELDARTIVIGALGGVAGVIGLIALYRALAIGPMVLVPPIAASGVALPVIVGLARGSMPSVLTLGGLVCAVVGVVLAAYASPDPTAGPGVERRLAPGTLGLCLVAAVGFALVFVALDVAAGDSVPNAVVATAGVRIGSLATVLVAIVALRIDPTGGGVSVRSAAMFAGIGAIDTSANLAFAIASTIGRLEVVAVLGSLYPAVTSALAAALLGERIAVRQLVGVLLTIGGIVLLAGG